MQKNKGKKRLFPLYLLSVPLLTLATIFSCSGPGQQVAEEEEVSAGVQYVFLSEAVEVPTWNAIATDLGIPESEMQDLTEKLVGVMRYGRNSRYYSELCEGFELRCTALDSYISDSNDAYQRHKKSRRERKKYRKRFRLKVRATNWAQKLDVRRSIRGLRIRSFREFTRLATSSLKKKQCPRNLSAALSLRAMEYFPNETAARLSKKLFNHAQPCLSNAHPSFEILHLRQGLAALMSGDQERAKRLMLMAMDGAKTKELYRSLFWLGWIENERGSKEEENTSWQTLNKTYPLSYYAIAARRAWGRDSLEAVPEQGPYTFSRVSKLRPEVNARLRWLEALILAGERRHAIRWVEWMVRHTKDLEGEVVNYISSMLLREGFYRQNIVLLSRYYRKHPERISRVGLRSLYPRPFFENVHEEAKNKIHTNLVMSLIRQESAFDPHAVSPSRAKGLMQIIPRTTSRLQPNGHRRLFDAKQNTKMGVKYLMRLANRFEGKIELVLAAYNAGPRRVDRWLRRNPDRGNELLWNDLIPFIETRDYVVSILRNNYWYDRIYGSLDIDKDMVLGSKLVKELMAAE